MYFACGVLGRIAFFSFFQISYLDLWSGVEYYKKSWVWNSLSRSFALLLFALSLKIAHIKERLCSIRSCCSLRKSKLSNREWIALVALYKRKTVSESLSWLFKKEQLWAIRSCRSWQKSDGSVSLFFMSKSLFCSFAHKKRAIRSKNRWANSQPCKKELD